MLIEFDADKDQANEIKHGFSLALAHRIDFAAVTVEEDPRQYEGERRYRGYTMLDGRLYCFWFTWRGEACRVIGMRKANLREVKRYGA